VRATVARVSYREHPVPPGLRALAECVWVSSAPVAAERVDVLPDGCMDLFWSGAALFVAGPDTAPHPYTHPPGLASAGVRFHPGVLPALLGAPAAAVRDARVPLVDLAPRPARRAAALIESGAPATAVLAGLTTSLPGGAPEPGMRAAAARLAAGASVTDTAEALGWTTRTLHRHCLAAFGYGPAVLRRVLRFRRALALLRGGIATADVAARTGYADQPHLSREVRALAGAAPAQLVSGAKRSTPVPSGSWTVA
jgi:AraC-like DNA-binding protein